MNAPAATSAAIDSITDQLTRAADTPAIPSGVIRLNHACDIARDHVNRMLHTNNSAALLHHALVSAPSRALATRAAQRLGEFMALWTTTVPDMAAVEVARARADEAAAALYDAMFAAPVGIASYTITRDISRAAVYTLFLIASGNAAACERCGGMRGVSADSLVFPDIRVCNPCSLQESALTMSEGMSREAWLITDRPDARWMGMPG